VLFKRSWDYWLLWVVALASLAVNVFLVNTLLQVRRQVSEGAAQAARAVGQLRESAINYTVSVTRSIPVSLTVPFQTTVVVPVSATLPIATDVIIPLDTPFGQFPVTVPIRASIPVNLQTDVPINITVPISASVPVKLDMPINFELAETELGQALVGVEAYLETVANQLRADPLQPK
jgi:hypothetical protein